MISQEQFESECRQLWREVAVAYATDGVDPEKMRIWTESAVSNYRRNFSKYVKEKTYD